VESGGVKARRIHVGRKFQIMKRSTFILQEAGYQAAERDFNTYGREMILDYPDWDENQPFEEGYLEYFREKKHGKI
jgi:hypothetical protein